jgi:hypothetical protein
MIKRKEQVTAFSPCAQLRRGGNGRVNHPYDSVVGLAFLEIRHAKLQEIQISDEFSRRLAGSGRPLKNGELCVK